MLSKHSRLLRLRLASAATRTLAAGGASSSYGQRPSDSALLRPWGAQESHGASAAAALACLAAAAAAFASEPSACEEANSYPTIRRAEVAKHKSAADGGIWVTSGDGVYDITEFVKAHPGGAQRIMMAAGGSIDPFWKLYAVHNKEEVREIRDALRIGTLPPEDIAAAPKEADLEDPFAKEPERPPIFQINSAKPFNAEPPPELLMDGGPLTPNELFFIRNHLPVPEIDAAKYKLEIEIEGVNDGMPLLLSLEELKMFPAIKVGSVVQCAGNRRTEMNRVKPVKGLSWTFTAISNAEWTGVRLRDVLKAAGMDVDATDGPLKHVQFEGLDKDMTTCYGASILAEKATDPRGDVILAYEMNGEPIPRDHGYPVRVVVPGVVGARNVKWLAKVKASATESQNHWQQKDYKGFSPEVDWNNVDFGAAPAIQELPVTSAICSPLEGSSVSVYDDTVTVKGYAWSGGGRGIVRVDVSADGGKSWVTADLKPTGQPLSRTWAWTLWEAEMPVTAAVNSELQLVCKATDASYNVQPEDIGPFWNLRGCLTNSWHRVRVPVTADDEEEKEGGETGEATAMATP